MLCRFAVELSRSYSAGAGARCKDWIVCRSTVSKGQTEVVAANKIAATSLFGNDSDREIAIRRAASNALAGGLLSLRVAVPFAFSFRSSLSISVEVEMADTSAQDHAGLPSIKRFFFFPLILHDVGMFSSLEWKVPVWHFFFLSPSS